MSEQKPLRVPLVQAMGTRAIPVRQDAYMLNLLTVKYGSEIVAERRPGFIGTPFQFLSGYPTFADPAISRQFAWPATDGFPEAQVTVYYKPTSSLILGNARVTSSLITDYTAGIDAQYTNAFADLFVSGLAFSTGNQFLIHGTLGFGLLTRTGTSPYTCTYADLTIPGSLTLAPGIALLDDYFFIMDVDRRIYNCAVGDPTTWNVLDFLQLQSDAAVGTAIASHMNYVIGFTQKTMTPLYDAGLPSPGSPLLPVQSAIRDVGCQDGTSLQRVGGSLFWVGSSGTGSVGVYMMPDGSLTPQRISTSDVDSYLSSVDLTTPRNRQNPSLLRTWAFTYKGHALYGVQVNTSDSNPTVVYDSVAGQWYFWGCDASGATFGYVPFVGLAAFADNSFGATNNVNAYVYNIQEGTYTDSNITAGVTQNIFCEVQTDYLDYGSYQRKTFETVAFVADRNGLLTGSLSYTDDDYGTFSVPRTINLGSARPMTKNLGSCYRRAWRFSYVQPTPLRLRAMDLDAKAGIS